MAFFGMKHIGHGAFEEIRDRDTKELVACGDIIEERMARGEWIACWAPERVPGEGCSFHLDCAQCAVLVEVAFRNGLVSERFRNFIVYGFQGIEED